MKGKSLAGVPQRQDYRTPESLRLRVLNFARSQGVALLDPCAGVHRADHWADHNYTEAGNGLERPWHVAPMVFANIPYRDADAWADRAGEQRTHVDLGVLLVPVYSDTRWFNKMVDLGGALVMLKGRLSFELPYRDRKALEAKGKRIKKAPARFPSCLISFGQSRALHEAWCKRWQLDERARVVRLVR